MMKKFLVAFTAGLMLVFVSCTTQHQEPKAKYVFLFIGDGMGATQVYSTELYLSALNDVRSTTNLNLSKLSIQSYMTTYSANSWITCSSASGTALASGNKTNNGVLGKDSSLTVKFETVAEKAKKAGFKVGILSSVGINHATPASFYAHQNKRSMYYEIASELPLSNFDYFGGGGFISPKGKDGQQPDAYELAAQAGYQYLHTAESIKNIKAGDRKVLAVNPVLLSNGEFAWEIDKNKESISLAEFTRKGIEVVDNPKGFFMMVEGGKIDWACHANDAAASIHEVLAFDKAVAEAIKFYNQHPDETLIIVTADHETGGMMIGNGVEPNLRLLENQKTSVQEFGRILVQFQQTNPKATFEQVMELIGRYFGLGDASKGLGLTSEELAQFKESFQKTFDGGKGLDPDKDYLEQETDISIPSLAVAILNKKAGIGWTSFDHSATPVPVRVMGQGQNYFVSSIDNTDIPKIMGKMMGL
ncbi:MAG TPA: alkaline phosphatase [Marinilabiliales bacterium]|nr:alkaline phosphatase [Marinilabiliales bacterium]HAZ01944.1 alkaline phosphatase [Marinilabiliales bacterium]HBO74940.1 alkaline phosphatase [Marinilabiliales bacterium]HBX86833.1 alkaline phosphatase [Marinilabiliales bacterium]HBY54788.1 alkaline phosphatase [Marinilabiliales bacterium]